MTLTVETLKGDAVATVIDAVSELRCEVFRAWPYLYEGDRDYEASYLAEFAAADDAVVVVARDSETIVGAATAAPLMSHTSEFSPLFEAHGFDPARVFYFGESVLRASHRGQGIGHLFFDHREAAAQMARNGDGNAFALTAFCGVIRPDNDKRRPPDYRALDGFWRKRGYQPVATMIGHYDWREIGHDDETRKAMQFWVRPLPAPSASGG